MKKTLNLILAVLLFALCAFSFTACNNVDNNSSSEKGLLIKKFNGVYTIYDYVDDNKLTDGVLDIGAILTEKGYDSVTIKKGAFDDVSNIKKIIVSDKVSLIEEGAFRNMTGLEELEIPFVGKTAKADAYYRQTDDVALKSVDKQRTIAHFFGTSEYSGATAMTAIDETVVYMPITLKTITLNITDKVFYDINDATVKGKFYSIPYQAFKNATNISKIVINSVDPVQGELGVQEIGEEAFSGCFALREIEIPKSVKTIYKDAFLNCTNLTKVDIKGSDVVVKSSAFKGCVKMDKLNSASALTVDLAVFSDIGKEAFDFGVKDFKFTVLNKGSFDLTKIFGSTLTK